MKLFLWSIALACSLAPAISATTDERIAAAHQAYDRGDHESARVHFEALTKLLPGSFEVWYNAANNSFRAGRAGEAVLYYRRAWYLNPRDADVRANMQLVQQRLGALAPATTLLDQAARELSQREWMWLFRTSYWSGLAIAAMMIFVGPARRWLRLPLTALVVVTLVALGGWWYWQAWQKSTEAVITGGRQIARYEPRETATELFSAPEGSIVHVEESFDQWIKINADGTSGWIPASAAERVMAWKTP